MWRLGNDIQVNPAKAVEIFLKSKDGKRFHVDRSYEYFHITQHAGGFLQRS